MIIFGWRGVTYTKDRGEFFCPGCTAQTAYKMKRVRNFFTLYFIPLIPLNKMGDFVECTRCRNQFKAEVLDMDTEKMLAEAQASSVDVESEYFVALRRIMIETMVAKGHALDSERSEVIAAYTELSGQQLTHDMLNQEVGQAQREPAGLSALRALAPNLNERGKETVLFAAYRIAMADGVIADEEWSLIAEIGEALAMTPSHINGAIAEAESKYGRPTFD